MKAVSSLSQRFANLVLTWSFAVKPEEQVVYRMVARHSNVAWLLSITKWRVDNLPMGKKRHLEGEKEENEKQEEETEN